MTATLARLLSSLLLVLLLGTPAHAGIPSFSRAPDVPAILSHEPPPVPTDWQSFEGLFADTYGSPADARTLRRLSQHAQEAVPRLADELGLPAGRTIHVVLAPDRAQFFSMQPGAVPRWAEGTAWPQRGWIYLKAPSARDGTASPLETVLDHELVHVILGRAFAPRPVPAWLQEGTAQLLAREYTTELTDALASGLLGHSLLSLDQITGRFPADASRAHLAYAQSADLVAFIRNTWGPDALRVLVREMSRGRSVGASMRAATGHSVPEVDTMWRGRLQRSLLWTRPLASDNAILGLASVFFVIAGALAWRRRRRRLHAMAEEEARIDARERLQQSLWERGQWDHPVASDTLQGWSSPF